MNTMEQIPENATRLDKLPPRHPVNGTFELTVRCNLHCKMCLFRHDDSENAEIMAKELTAAQWIDIARQAAEAGTFNLLITGGEPMLRPDFCEIWEGIYQQGFFITLYTNATLITPQIMETLRKYPPHKIGVTIYGATPETYGKVCGNEDAFEKAIAGIHQLQTLPSVLEFRSTIIKDNYHEVSMIEDLARTEFGYTTPIQQPRSLFTAVRGGCSKVEQVRLDPKENVELIFHRGIQQMKRLIGEDRFKPENMHIVVEAVETPEPECRVSNEYTLLGCDAGMNSYAIAWDGKLQGCQTLGLFAVDTLNNGLQAAWDQFPFMVKLPPMNEKCKQCKIAQHCQTCYASRYAETGNICGCPDYQCQDAQEIVNHYMEV